MDLPTEVFKMADMVSYQDGSVVSRTLVDRLTGTVTLFAFAEGQGLSEHTAPFDAMVCLLDGDADIAIAGNTFRLTQGQTVIMPANKPHSLKAVTRFKMMLVMIRS